MEFYQAQKIVHEIESYERQLKIMLESREAGTTNEKYFHEMLADQRAWLARRIEQIIKVNVKE